jgi:hypothetical protein
MFTIACGEVCDVKVIDQLIKKAAKGPYQLRSFAAGGCGKIVGKAHAWAQNLRDQGCRYLVLVHDLDFARVARLRIALEKAIGTSPISPYLIVIPVREIEAWLLADHEAIKKAMKLTGPVNKIANPEGLQNPKEHLGRLIYIRSDHKKRYINAIHNVQIAAACSGANLNRCASYVPFQQFIRQNI